MKPSFLLAAACLLTAALRTAHGHGFMFEPRARNVVHNSDYCPQCLSAGGPWVVSAGGTLTWPAGVHGICGDVATDLKHEPGGIYGSTGIQATYNSGDVITISLLITAKHGGRHKFSICDRTNADEACLQAHVLQRADGTGPYTWQNPAGGPAIPASGYSVGTVGSYTGEIYNMQYKLPDGFTCAQCTLQWEWVTGNSCNVPGSPWSTGMEPCDSQGPYPEEFWNCADVSISGDGASTSTPVNPQPTPTTTPTPTQPTNDPTPTQPATDPTPTQPAPTTNPTPAADPAQSTPTYDRKLNPGSAGNDASSICASSGSGLFPAPWSCAEFVNCGNGSGASMACPPGTMFDAASSACNFADQVDCGGRPQ